MLRKDGKSCVRALGVLDERAERTTNAFLDRRGSDEKIAVLTTYVNDTFLTGNDWEEIRRMAKHLLGKYKG